MVDSLAKTSASPPKILILTATWNGALWLDDQLGSFAAQRHVEVKVVISDDKSTDATAEVLEAWSRRLDLTILPSYGERFGNANGNFMRLVRDAPMLDCDFVCFSDQDDIWVSEKLNRAVSRLQETGSDAYSSNVTAFWEDGRERLIVKSQRQRPLDHLFESAGPGCTFVLTKQAFLRLRNWATARQTPLAEVRVHDWTIYAFGREDGWRWIIDDFSGVRYRQHALNEIGANIGFKSALRRFYYLVGGKYRADVIRIARVCGHQSHAIERLQRLAWYDRLALAFQARRFRRKSSDAFAVAVALLITKREPPAKR